MEQNDTPTGEEEMILALADFLRLRRKK